MRATRLGRTEWVLGALALLALALRVYRLDFVSLRGDEAFTVIFVQRTWEGLWKGISTVEPNPPLLYLALRAWVALAGAGEFATRYFSVFFGVLCVPLTYRLARELFSRRVGALAAFLVAINPYQVWHSQDVRNYTMWPALSLLALVFFWQWWKREERNSLPPAPQGKARNAVVLLILYAVATSASLYTHYYDTFILVAENVFVFAIAGWARRWRTLARWTGAQVFLALVYVPWVLFGTNRVTTYGEASAEQSVGLLDQFSRTLATLVLSDTLPAEWKTALWVPLAVVVAAALGVLVWRERVKGVFLFLYLAVPALALYAISVGRPLFLERYLNGIAPGYYILLAVAIAGVAEFLSAHRRALGAWKNQSPRASVTSRRWSSLVLLAPFLVLAGVALGNYYFDPAYAKAPDWRALGKYIAERQQPGDVIVQNFNEMSAIYYRNGTLPVVTVPKDYWAMPEDEATLEQLNRQYRRIWFIPAQPDYWDQNHFVERYLSRYDDRTIEQDISVFRLQLYATPGTFAPSIIPVNARVGQATLAGYRIEGPGNNGALKPGAANLRVVLYWRAIEKMQKELSVFVHLADAGERVVAQQDSAPVGGTWLTTDWKPGELVVDAYRLSTTLAPGQYTLVVGMYDPATLARVPVFDSRGVAQADERIVLTKVNVAQ